MAFTKWLIDFIVILNVQIFISHVVFGDSDDVYYVAQFNDKIIDCEGFQNTVFVCENVEAVFESESDGSDGGYRLLGQLNLKKPITDEISISLMIYKDTPAGKEFMYSIGGNVCESLKKEDTPWYPFVEVFNSSECPIETGVYNLKDLVISLTFAKDVLRHELCGDYNIELELQTDLQKTLACYNVALEVIEKTY